MNDVDTLTELAAGKLESFLDEHGLDVPKRAWRVRIVEGLAGKLMALSTRGTPLPASQLVAMITSWVRGIREEQKLLIAPAHTLTPWAVFHVEADGGKAAMELFIESSGTRTCVGVTGRWRWVGPYSPGAFEKLGRYLTHDNEFEIGGPLDPRVRKRASWVQCDRMAVQSRLEVEVGARDVPRRLYYYDAPMVGIPPEKFQWTRKLKPFELQSDVKPGLFAEYFGEFGRDLGYSASWDPSLGSFRVERKWEPPEKYQQQ